MFDRFLPFWGRVNLKFLSEESECSLSPQFVVKVNLFCNFDVVKVNDFFYGESESAHFHRKSELVHFHHILLTFTSFMQLPKSRRFFKTSEIF